VIPIKDTDFLTATMRIRCREKNLMTGERADRLIEARGDDEAIKLLSECGYGEMQSLSNDELDRVLRQFHEELYALMEEILPAPALLAVFRVRYDYHNVKALLKSSDMEEEGRGLLVNLGRIPAMTLYESFAALEFGELPHPFSSLIPEARELLARTGDPQKVDFLLDSACLAEMMSIAQKSKSKFVREYVRLYIDIQNLRALVRTWRIGKDAEFLRAALASGGHIPVERVRLCLEEKSPIAALYAETALSGLAEAAEKAAGGQGPLTDFERLCDNLLLDNPDLNRFIPFGEQPVLAYLLFREAEMTMIRTVVSGRMAGVPAAKLREKLRARYA